MGSFPSLSQREGDLIYTTVENKIRQGEIVSCNSFLFISVILIWITEYPSQWKGEQDSSVVGLWMSSYAFTFGDYLGN